MWWNRFDSIQVYRLRDSIDHSMCINDLNNLYRYLTHSNVRNLFLVTRIVSESGLGHLNTLNKASLKIRGPLTTFSPKFLKIFIFWVFRPKAALFYVHWELSELVFVRPSKCSVFWHGSGLRNRMKLNMCTYLEHACISILTLKTGFDYKRAFIHYALQPPFSCRIYILQWSSLNLHDFFSECTFLTQG